MFSGFESEVRNMTGCTGPVLLDVPVDIGIGTETHTHYIYHIYIYEDLREPGETDAPKCSKI